jgi:hypothetical protein
VIDTDFPVEKGSTMSKFLDHATEVVDRAGRSAPASDSIDDLISWADSIGPDVLRELNEWQPKRAVVIQMPKQRRRSRRQS